MEQEQKQKHDIHWWLEFIRVLIAAIAGLLGSSL